MNYESIYLGQLVMRYKVPLDVFHTINQIYETHFDKLRKANDQLIGKIETEQELFSNSVKKDTENFNVLPPTILHFFIDKFKHYLKMAKVDSLDMKLNSIWINEMKENEYNPVHVHKGDSHSGLSSVMILKLPSTFGKEYSAARLPQNGRLQILGSASGQFAKIDYQPPMELGDFYIFPYDMRHVVYPFNGTNETRRTLAANCDVKYNPTTTKGFS